MKKKISPNRMELFRVRKRLLLAQRGHKLLKDKLEGIIREMTDRLDRYKGLRRRFDEAWMRVQGRFTIAASVAPRGAVADAIRQNAIHAHLSVAERRFMGISFPVFTPPALPPGFRYSVTRTPPELDAAFAELRAVRELLFALAEAERGLQLLAHELERTRRRTNALEYVLIPELQAERRDIEQKISEQERANVSRLMKIKDILQQGR